MALSETRITPDIDDNEVSVPGYGLVRSDAENRRTGEVAIFVRNDIRFEIILVSKLISNYWYIALNVNVYFYKGTIAVIYHSPSASDGDFVKFLEDIIEELMAKNKKDCIVLGDFNLNVLSDTFYVRKLQTLMLGWDMKQLVDRPTRITKDSQTFIDLVFANKKLNVQVINEPKITNHAWLKINFDVKKTR